jgi:CrcB protein
MTASLYVALGGAVGAVLRYQLGRAVDYLSGSSAGFPWATMTVNVLGSLCMGVLMGWLAKNSVGNNEAIRLFIGVGLLGGFTTFSTFSAEMVTLFHRGQLLLGFTYGSVSMIAGMAALLIGLVMIQSAP